jgi:hypothetical protein
LNPANGLNRKPDYREYAEKLDQTIFPTLKNKLRLRNELNIINIYISYVSTKLITGNSQPVSLPENTEPALTQIVRNGSDVDSKNNSDSENELQSRNNAYQIARILSRAVTKKVFKNQSPYAEPSETVINLLLKLQQKDAFCIGREWEKHLNNVIDKGTYKRI